MQNNPKKNNLNWKDYYKLNENQKAVLQTNKNIQDNEDNQPPMSRSQRILLQVMKDRQEKRKESKPPEPTMTRSERLRAQAFKNFTERKIAKD